MSEERLSKLESKVAVVDSQVTEIKDTDCTLKDTIENGMIKREYIANSIVIQSEWIIPTQALETISDQIAQKQEEIAQLQQQATEIEAKKVEIEATTPLPEEPLEETKDDE